MEHALRIVIALCLALSALACDGGPGAADSGGPAPGGDGGLPPPADDGGPGVDAGGPGGTCEAGSEVVGFDTPDGVTLEADFHSTGDTGGPAVVLFHMVPPANDRSNYSSAFIDLLTARGISVLNVDRRGAGGSGGVAQEAYFGPNGKWDAVAAYRFLAAHACSFDTTRIGMVGASNGTTTVMDFTVYAATQADTPVPAAIVWLTPDTYTEAQNRVSTNRPLLDSLPILFVYSTAEAAWSNALVADEGSRWMFHEYADGEHGTFMFAVRPDAMPRVADWLQTNL